jgi:hypothetical protein
VVRRFVIACIVVLCAIPLRANEVVVDHHRLPSGGLLTITVTLEGTFAAVDDVDIPLTNLAIVGDPSVSSEFAFINGTVSRRKVFRYRARPLAPGPARVGPLVLNAGDGQRDTLPAIDVEVLPDTIMGSNDPETVLRELLAADRDPLFVISEVDKQSAYVGEPVTVTWWLYNAAVVQQWQVAAAPKLPEFWSEEQSRNETPERVYIGNVMVQRLPVRRVVLFPLQSGRTRIGGLTVHAAVLRRSRRGPFAMFEGDLTETTFTSAPVPLDVQPIPPGPPVDAVGDLALDCVSPVQQNGGPVVVRVTLSGVGNLRAATPPRFGRPLAGTVQIEGGEVKVVRDEGAFAMSRQWRYLIMPAQSGPLEVPPLSMQIFDSGSGQRRELSCGPAFINAVTAEPSEAPLPPVTVAERSVSWPWYAAGLALLLVISLAVPPLRRELSLRREVRELVRDATPGEIRVRVEARVPVHLREASERGDAWRALYSLLDAAERERDIAVDSDREIARRVRDVLEAERRAATGMRESRPSP